MNRNKPSISGNSSLEELNEFHATVFEPLIHKLRTITPMALDKSLCKSVCEDLGIKLKSNVAWYLSKLPLSGNGHIRPEDMLK